MANTINELVRIGMTEAQAIEAVADYTEADYAAEWEAEAYEAELEAQWRKAMAISEMHYLGWVTGLS